MYASCSPRRLPRPLCSTSAASKSSVLAPTASPRVNRPPDSSCTEAACFASSAVERSGPIAIIVARRTREVAAAAAASAANGS
jgi:hypothetical protein